MSFPFASVSEKSGGRKTKERRTIIVRTDKFLENVGSVRFELTIDGSLRQANMMWMLWM
jgi:hypothetical protein